MKNASCGSKGIGGTGVSRVSSAFVGDDGGSSGALSSDWSGGGGVAEDDCPEGDEELDGCRNVSTLAHFLTFGIVVKKFIVAVPFARRIASTLESEGKFLV